MTWTELYGGTSRDVAGVLEYGPLILSGFPGSGRAPLVRELTKHGPTIEVWPRRAATLAGLKLDLLNALLEELSALPQATTRRDFQRLVVAAFGQRAREVLASAERGEAAWISIPDILAGLPASTTVIVHDAHLLPAVSDRVLWALRARAQERDAPRLALLTRTWHRDVLLGPEAAFFGFGQAIDLPIPGRREWAALSGLERDHELVWLLEQTRGLPRVTMATLGRIRESGDVHAAWRAQVHESGRVADEVLRLVYGLHPYAPRLLAGVAAGERVYPSVPERRTDAVAAALGKMRDHDVIYQPRPRKWLVADPALVPHLAATRVP